MSDGGRMSRDTACNGQSSGDVGAEGRRLRILHVVIQAGPTNSQWNEHCVPVADEREITVCSLYPGTVDPDPRISRIDGDGSLRGAVSALRTALRRRDYDVVHVHAPASAAMLMAACALERRGCANVVLTLGVTAAAVVFARDVASRTERTILHDMGQDAAAGSALLDEALSLAERLAEDAASGRVDLADLGRRARKLLESDIADTEAYIEDAAERMRQVWQLFKDMEPKKIEHDETIFRELKERFGSPYGFGEYFRGGMGAEAVRDLIEQVDLEQEAQDLRDTVASSKGQKRQKAIKRLKMAIKQAERLALLGNNIFGTPFSFAIRTLDQYVRPLASGARLKYAI